MDVDSTMGSETETDNNNNQIPSTNDNDEAPPSISSDELDQSSSATTSSSSPTQQQGAVAGPRPAPTYTVVNALIEKKEDGPGPRCGHTLTAVAAVGEEGSLGYIGSRLILFGGATALEGNSAVAGPPSPAGSAGIRLAGATADVHCYDVASNKWSRLTPLGEQPSPRAAHVATAVGTMVVIQGGIGPAGLSAEDLHVLDLTQQRPRWHRVVVQGPGPGPRYGHVMALVGQRFLLAIGGNDGKRPLADVWALDTAVKPYEWRKLEPEGDGPPPCMVGNDGNMAEKTALKVFEEMPEPENAIETAVNEKINVDGSITRTPIVVIDSEGIANDPTLVDDQVVGQMPEQEGCVETVEGEHQIEAVVKVPTQDQQDATEEIVTETMELNNLLQEDTMISSAECQGDCLDSPSNILFSADDEILVPESQVELVKEVNRIAKFLEGGAATNQQGEDLKERRLVAKFSRKKVASLPPGPIKERLEAMSKEVQGANGR